MGSDARRRMLLVLLVSLIALGVTAPRSAAEAPSVRAVSLYGAVGFWPGGTDPAGELVFYRGIGHYHGLKPPPNAFGVITGAWIAAARAQCLAANAIVGVMDFEPIRTEPDERYDVVLVCTHAGWAMVGVGASHAFLNVMHRTRPDESKGYAVRVGISASMSPVEAIRTVFAAFPLPVELRRLAGVRNVRPAAPGAPA
jgi:hypothetical protein